MTMKIDGFTLNVERDDRGALVAELWHNESGKTVGITEVDNYEMARWWGSKLANMTAAKAS